MTRALRATGFRGKVTLTESPIVRALLVGAVIAFTGWVIVKFVEQPLAPRIRAALAPKTAAPAGHARKS